MKNTSPSIRESSFTLPAEGGEGREGPRNLAFPAASGWQTIQGRRLAAATRNGVILPVVGGLITGGLIWCSYLASKPGMHGAMNLAPDIPDHSLLRLIGRGAYGEVWLARNIMGTVRAVKVIWRKQFESDRPYEREFAGIRRFEPISRSSGGLVHVLHVGRNDAVGYFFYVMELADPEGSALDPSPTIKDKEGSLVSSLDTTQSELYRPRTLRSDLKRLGRLQYAACVRLALDVASGLAQLHRHGLVHRDVKPGNIIYVNARAKLADVGLVSAGGEGLTFVGTEGYIPPEGPGTPSADIYALGIALYEASTGFSLDRFPDAPPEWFTDAAGDPSLELHEVILKACEGRRENRYPSVEAMQADLALLQSGQSVRRVRALERRYARLRACGIAGSILLMGALLAAFLAHYRERVAAESRAREAALRERVEESLARASSAERQSRQQLYTALLEQAKATVHSGELGQRVRALDAIRRAGAISNTAELRGAAIAALALPDLRLERTLSTEAPLVRLDPTFERMAICRERNPVEIRTVADERLVANLLPASLLPARNVKWSDDGRFLAVTRAEPFADSHLNMEIWDTTRSRRILSLADLEFGEPGFHPRLPRVMTGARNGTAIVWDLASEQECARFHFAATPEVLRYSADGKQFAASYQKGNGWAVSVHNSDDGALVWSQPLEAPASMDWERNGQWLAVADYDGVVRLMDSKTGAPRTLGSHKAQASTVTFSPDGAFLLTGGWEKELICWDLARMERAFNIPLNSFRAQFGQDGRQCAIFDGSRVHLYAFERPGNRMELADDLGPRSHYAAFSPDSRWLAISASRGIGVWDLTHCGPAGLTENISDPRVFFSPDGELFASTDEECFHWRVTPSSNGIGRPQLEALALTKPEGFSSLCVASNDLVVTASRGSYSIGKDSTGAAPSPCLPTSPGVSKASADGQLVGIFRPFTPCLHIYRMPGLSEVASLTNHANVARFDLSPGGNELAVSTPKGVEFWSTATWQRTGVLTNFVSLLYAPDGTTLWLTHDFRTAGLYDAQTLQLLLPLPSGTLPLAVSPDGRYLAASVDLRRLQVWDLFEVQGHLKDLGLNW
jgi:WD40 repeat protein